MAYDPESAVGTSGLNNPFSEGIVLSASPSWKVKIGNSLGEHAVRVAISTQDGKNLYNLGDIQPPVDIPTTDKKFRYYANYSFNQPLVQIDDKHSWGLFGQIGFSDGNPNPVDFSFQFGVGGNSFFKNRKQDKWGAALYNYSLSSIIDDIAENIGVELRNELGFETFYQFWLNQYFSLGGNIQIINPIVKNSDAAVFLGLRTSIKF